jgi:hypothetical protein
MRVFCRKILKDMIRFAIKSSSVFNRLTSLTLGLADRDDPSHFTHTKFKIQLTFKMSFCGRLYSLLALNVLLPSCRCFIATSDTTADSYDPREAQLSTVTMRDLIERGFATSLVEDH